MKARENTQRVQLSYQAERTFMQRQAEHEAAAQRRTSWLAPAQCRQQLRRFEITTFLLLLLLLINWLFCHYLSAS